MILVAPALQESPAAKIAALEAENAALRDRLAQIEQDLLGSAIVTPRTWALTPNEERTFLALLMRKQATRGQLLTAVYSDQRKDAPFDKVLDQFICRIRKKLRPHGIEISTVWGAGWAIEEPLRSMLKRALDPGTSAVEEHRMLALIAEGALAA